MFRLLCKVAFTVVALPFFFGSQPVLAGVTTEIVVKLHTTDEPKAEGEQVFIIVEERGVVLGKKELGRGKIHKGNKREVTFNFPRPHETRGMKVKIIKEGGQGWEFQVNVEANRRLIYESRRGVIKFKGKDKNDILLQADVHEAWLDLR
jgi:hypothetical protein